MKPLTKSGPTLTVDGGKIQRLERATVLLTLQTLAYYFLFTCSREKMCCLCGTRNMTIVKRGGKSVMKWNTCLNGQFILVASITMSVLSRVCSNTISATYI